MDATHLQLHHLLHKEHYLLLSLNYDLMMAFEAHQLTQDNLALSLPATNIFCTIWSPGYDCDGSPLLTLVHPVNHTLDSCRKITAQLW